MALDGLGRESCGEGERTRRFLFTLHVECCGLIRSFVIVSCWRRKTSTLRQFASAVLAGSKITAKEEVEKNSLSDTFEMKKKSRGDSENNEEGIEKAAQRSTTKSIRLVERAWEEGEVMGAAGNAARSTEEGLS